MFKLILHDLYIVLICFGVIAIIIGSLILYAVYVLNIPFVVLQILAQLGWLYLFG